MCSFSALQSLAEVLATFLWPGKVSGPCRRVVRRRRLLGLWACPSGVAYGTLGACGVHLRLFQPHPLFVH